MDDRPPVIRVDFDGDVASPSFDIWRENIGRGFLRFDFEPRSDGPAHIRTRMHLFADVVVGWCSTTPMKYYRTGELVRDGSDDLVLLLPRTGAMQVGYRGEPIDFSEQAIALWDIHLPGHVHMPASGAYSAIRLRRARIQALCPAVDDILHSPVLRSGEAGQLLRHYIDLVAAPDREYDAAARFLIGQHITDLAALAIGASTDAKHEALQRGWRAARFEQIKADIVANLAQPGFSVQLIAQRHKVSERHIQSLFEQADTTFTAFVLEHRLRLAFRLLCDPGNDARKVTDVAYAAGFGDVSYFHRCFRRRFGDTPLGVREAAIRDRSERRREAGS